MNNDFFNLAVALETLLADNKEPFRFDLTKFGTILNNTPRRKYFDMASDCLTCTSLCEKVGKWCVAEIEGTDVQFNPVVPVK